MGFDKKQYDEFEVTSLERKMLAKLALSKDFDILCTVMMRYLVWRSHMLSSSPLSETQDMELINIQGGHQLLKKLLELVNGNDHE